MNNIKLPAAIKTSFIGRLEIVFDKFQFYFNDRPFNVSWCRDPFNLKIDPCAQESEKLEDLKVLNAMKLAFKNKNDVSSSWWSLHDEYPLLSKFVLMIT